MSEKHYCQIHTSSTVLNVDVMEIIAYGEEEQVFGQEAMSRLSENPKAIIKCRVRGDDEAIAYIPFSQVMMMIWEDEED